MFRKTAAVRTGYRNALFFKHRQQLGQLVRRDVEPAREPRSDEDRRQFLQQRLADDQLEATSAYTCQDLGWGTCRIDEGTNPDVRVNDRPHPRRSRWRGVPPARRGTRPNWR